VTLTKDNFDEVVGGSEMVLIDFWADWCPPCRMFAPVFERASEQHSDLVFAKVDTEAEQELAAAFQISSIPTLAIIRDKVMIFSQPGALPDAALQELIGKAREVDMDEVRRNVEKQSQNQ
jgi:thioredoxin 1